MRIKHFTFIAMLAILMVANYLFYRKLEKTGPTAIEENQPVAADNIEVKGGLVFANRVIAVVYTVLACLVAWASVPICVGCMIFMLPALALAVGHYKSKEWALKASTVIFGAFSLLAFWFLFLYRVSLEPKLYVRIMLFAPIAMLAILMVANCFLYKHSVTNNA